ncbi:PQ-loop repeat-containing protein [Aspergillus clavatus NRRL 1]|uniref:PQ loop repeat protein n=1 Tax=Aspergillus clavatus (strain ATCC 1007 / CBS 513.65 / DSM 816 / NCTC 3887 / NRRL 1 / QM 1276 / 107) TaxID=344612 RepID=A1CKF2_ASPCL|nr:PQ loop repeat protein [Aspergillus clavatus NRRL 1]EAW09626.1 PQ loop repeat protein [Aspergillus clavatus NRRL 1]
MDFSNLECRHLVSPDYKNFVLSILIIFGILLSYLPQHIRIISLKSSFGISPYFVLLGTTSGTSALVNVVTQQQSLHDVACCKSINGVACFGGLLGIFQVATQWFCFVIILLLFVLYFPRATSPSSPTTSESSTRDGPTHKTALVVGGICILHALVMLIITAVFALQRPSQLQAWSNFSGVVAAILASIQYFPQIYTTVKLRCVGSLSIQMMCIQTPGSLVWAGSLAARLGPKGWSTWGVLIVTACLQGTLLMLAIFFEYFGPSKQQDHHHGKDLPPNGADEGADEHRDEQPSEETPLLQSH